MSGSSTPSPLLISSLSALSTSAGFARSVPGSSAPSTSAESVVPVPGSSVPSASAGFAGSLPGLSAPSASVGSAVLVPSLSALFASTPSASAPSASSGSAFPVPSLFVSAAPMLGSSAFSALVVTPIPGKQKLIELNRREKRVTSEELAFAFTPLLLSEPPLLFLGSHVGQKRSFNKASDIKCRLLANNQFGKDVDQSFAGCQCLPAIKANRS